MDSSSAEADFRRRPTSRCLFYDEPRNPQNSRPGPSTTYPVPSHYHELRQLEPEEDLMEFPSRPATPYTQHNPVNISVDDQSNVDSSKNQSQRWALHSRLLWSRPRINTFLAILASKLSRVCSILRIHLSMEEA